MDTSTAKVEKHSIHTVISVMCDLRDRDLVHGSSSSVRHEFGKSSDISMNSASNIFFNNFGGTAGMPHDGSCRLGDGGWS